MLNHRSPDHGGYREQQRPPEFLAEYLDRMASMLVVAAATMERPMSLMRGIAVYCRTLRLGRMRTVWMGARPHSCGELVLLSMGSAGHLVTDQLPSADADRSEQRARLAPCRPRCAEQ